MGSIEAEVSEIERFKIEFQEKLRDSSMPEVFKLYCLENLNAHFEITDEHTKSFGKERNQRTVQDKRTEKLICLKLM